METESDGADDVSRGADAELSDPLLDAGETLAGRYQVVRFIARGAMGEVYEAIDLELHERVALKRILPALASSPRVMARFKREIQLARRVTHPNVCRIYEFGTHRDTRGRIAFLTMELLDGETLATRLGRGACSTEEARGIVEQLVGALGAAHAAGVIHRDLKSHNVMLTPRGAMITDFGIACVAEEGQGELTGTGTAIGTPAYMAPEQIAGGEITTAVDIYALGVVMYEMVTGRRPYEAPTPLAVAAERLRRVPVPPRRHLAGLDPRWDATILRCLEREPVRRPAQPGEVLALLDGAPPRRRLPWIMATGAAAAAAIAAVALWPRSPTLTVGGPQSVAVLSLANRSGRADAAWLSTALSEMLTSEVTADGVTVIPATTVAAAHADLQLGAADVHAAPVLARIRDRLGADLVVAGSFDVTGSEPDRKLRLDVRLQRATSGAVVERVVEEGGERELTEVVARSGARLRAALQVKGSPNLGPSMPRSLEATRLYSEGLARLRAFDLHEARDLLARAVEAEPSFPLAHSALAQALSDLGRDREALVAARSARDHSTELPTVQRLLIAGRYHEAADEWNQAEAIYKSVFALQPDDLEVGLRLAYVQTVGQRLTDARSTLAALRRLPGAADDPRLDLLDGSCADDRVMEIAIYERAAETATRRGARLLRAEALRRLTSSYLYHGETRRAVSTGLEALALSRSLGDRFRTVDVLDTLAPAVAQTGGFPGALALHREAIATAMQAGSARNTAAASAGLLRGLLFVGEVRAARAGLAELRPLSVPIDAAGLAAAIFVVEAILLFDEGQIDLARQKADEMLLHAPDSTVANFFESLIAQIALAQDQLPMARLLAHKVEVVNQAHHEVFDTSFIRIVRAEIELEAGDASAAERLAREILPGGEEKHRMLHVLTLSVLARALVALDRRAEAITVIGAALPLWAILPLSHKAPVAIAALAVHGDARARARVESLLPELERAGAARLRIEAEFALATDDVAHGRSRSGRARLLRIADEARGRGYRLVERKAQELLR